MDIKFNQVIPKPLSSLLHSNESLWNSRHVLEEGKKNVVVAPSGKGKSTLIHLLYGTRIDYTGDISFGEKAFSTFSKRDWVNYRTSIFAIVFQDLQLFPQLTVLENLRIKNSLTNHFSNEELIEMLISVGLENKMNEMCGNLSMGQQQRVAILRALCQPFSWLFLDEPFSHLDEQNASICMSLINEHCAHQNAGWILTSLGEHSICSYDHLITI